MPQRTLLHEDDIRRAVTRMAHELLEGAPADARLVLLGIPSRGVPLARRIAKRISDVEGYDVPVGSLDVTMYRDDLRRQPTRTIEETDLDRVRRR